MIFLTDENQLKFDDSIICLYFYATWMPYLKRMRSNIAKLEEKYPNITFYGIDTDAFVVSCKRFNITSIPTILVYYQKTPIKRLEGIILNSALKSEFSNLKEIINRSENDTRS